MRQVRVLLVGLFVAVALAVTLHAQSYIWSSINGVPYAPAVRVGNGAETMPGFAFAHDPDTGFYSDNRSGWVRVASNGVEVARFEPTQSSIYNPFIVQRFMSVAVTTTYSPSCGSTGSGVFTNYGDSDGASVTLPSINTTNEGCEFTFMVVANQTFTITAASGQGIRIAGTQSADGASISANTVGNAVTLVAISGPDWYAKSVVGTWTF